MATRGCVGFRDLAEAEKQQNVACSKGHDRDGLSENFSKAFTTYSF